MRHSDREDNGQLQRIRSFFRYSGVVAWALVGAGVCGGRSVADP